MRLYNSPTHTIQRPKSLAEQRPRARDQNLDFKRSLHIKMNKKTPLLYCRNTGHNPTELQ